ncbi:hypothetical protein L6452_13904 [Arctium lappa]|uniref:Uncharacterized protein n=1 Tax=Arctium lappa TaxID=4217 RepID=A0ACB9CJH3_ARCLA|nr:hypothetical protein L6452_13904 [Arctium lappa]
MATIDGVLNGCVSSSTSSSSSSSFGKLKKFQKKKKTISGGAGKRFRVSCDFTNSIALDPYKTLRIHLGASESEVKKAFRQLALKYHPDVCKGSDCEIQFQQIANPDASCHSSGGDDSCRSPASAHSWCRSQLFLKGVDEVSAIDIAFIAQKLLSSSLTMTSHGDGMFLCSFEVFLPYVIRAL